MQRVAEWGGEVVDVVASYWHSKIPGVGWRRHRQARPGKPEDWVEYCVVLTREHDAPPRTHVTAATNLVFRHVAKKRGSPPACT